MARLKNIIEKTEDLGVIDSAASSEAVNITGGSVVSCQVVVDVQSTAKTFDSPQFSALVDQGLTYTSVDPGVAANDITIEITVPASGTNPLAVSNVGNAITISLETTAVVAATATLNITDDITLTSVAAGAARNTTTFTTEVDAAAANPGATVLAVFTGTAAAIICTITPNDGTNNGATPVDLTTAELRELITTGAVVGKTVTITDASNLRALQTATGGGATALAAGGEGDGVIATFSAGADFDDEISDADAVKAAVNADSPGAADLVLVTGSGAVALIPLVETNLEGGTDGEVDVDASTITIPSHGYLTGAEVRLTTTGTLPDPLQLATDYYVIAVDDNTIQLAESDALADAGTFIELVDAGSDDAVNTVTPVAIAGASVALYKSNDNVNWLIEGSATNITVDASVMLEKIDPSAKFYRATFAISGGSMGLQLYWLVKGIDG